MAGRGPRKGAFAFLGSAAWQTVKRSVLPDAMKMRDTLRDMDTAGDDGEGIIVRRRVAAWVQWWIAKKARDEVVINGVELERRLGVGAGTAYRILHADRLGLDVFLKIRRLVGKSADTLLDENPPGWKP